MPQIRNLETVILSDSILAPARLAPAAAHADYVATPVTVDGEEAAVVLTHVPGRLAAMPVDDPMEGLDTDEIEQRYRKRLIMLGHSSCEGEVAVQQPLTRSEIQKRLPR